MLSKLLSINRLLSCLQLEHKIHLKIEAQSSNIKSSNLKSLSIYPKLLSPKSSNFQIFKSQIFKISDTASLRNATTHAV